MQLDAPTGHHGARADCEREWIALEPVPQWTTELRPQTSGIDHLGLGSVSNQRILASLSPDLFVLTVHPGYHSFYSFVLDEFWKRDNLPRTRTAWRGFFRSKDLIYSIACHKCDHPDYEGQFANIVGSGTTARLADDPPRGGYPTDTNYIKSSFGGYGLYYRSVMASMGLVYLNQDTKYPVDVPSEKGKELAEQFRERISSTRYWKKYFEAERVPDSAVSELGQVACLCRLRNASPDLNMVRDIVLHAGLPAKAAGRRASLRMLLDLSVSTSGYPIDQASFRQLIYYGRDEYGAAWRPSTQFPTPENQLSLLDTWRRWRLYQAREFYAYALDGLWRWLVDWGIETGGEARPLPIAHAVEALASDIDPAALAEALDIKMPLLDRGSRLSKSIRSVRTLAGEPAIVPASDDGWGDRPFDVDADLTEWQLYATTLGGNVEGSLLATACLALLLLTAARFDDPSLQHRADWAYARAGGVQRLSFDQFVTGLRRLVDERATVAEVAEWVLREYVVAQHLRVAGSKLPYNTYRFVQEGSALRFFDRTRPIDLNSARFTALSHTLSDLGFVTPLVLEKHPATREGSVFLETGDWSSE